MPPAVIIRLRQRKNGRRIGDRRRLYGGKPISGREWRALFSLISHRTLAQFSNDAVGKSAERLIHGADNGIGLR